eukprot:10943119-Lingulodinium_polyedra.AAC.1
MAKSARRRAYSHRRRGNASKAHRCAPSPRNSALGAGWPWPTGMPPAPCPRSRGGSPRPSRGVGPT